MNRAWRLPALVVLFGLLVGSWFVQDQNASDEPAAVSVRLVETVPTASKPGSVSSTWYCAAGSATGIASGEGAGIAEQVVIIANDSDADATGSLTVIPESGQRSSVSLKILARSRQLVRVSDVAKSAWASALVEVTGGEVVVSHELAGPSGKTVGACASAPGSDWYFPAGTTRAGSRNLLALFNPFPGEATVDLTFDTDDGTRTPQQFQGLVIPGSRVVVVDVGAVVTLRKHVATTVSTRTGRLIAEQVQTTDGRDGTDSGLTSVLGGTTPAAIWVFADGSPAGSAVGETISVFNPSDQDATVQVQVQLDDQQTNGTVEPFEVTVASRRFAVVDLYSDPRVPRSVGHWVIVRTLDGAPVIVERSLTGIKGSGLPGLSHTMGVPIVATRWLVGSLVNGDVKTATLSVANPSATDTAMFTIRSITGGRVVDLSGAVDVSLAPGERRLVDVGALLAASPEVSFEIAADSAVSVGQWLQFRARTDFATPQAFPVSGTQALLRRAITPQAGAGIEIDPSLAPDGTAVISGDTVTTSVLTTTTLTAG
jgi:hypothetical protein